jgi:leucyl/phenylalanyl-tRNA---protein transferase
MHDDALINTILNAYRDGIFPMAENAESDDFAFYKPHLRALIPIENLHIPRRLLKTLRQNPYTVSMNTAFADVVDSCAHETPKRPKTWINKPIHDIFCLLHQHGHAHSVECKNKDGKLVGGLYGLSIGAVFCGESMFSRQDDASKIALVYLCALLWKCGYTTLDTQFINPHLVQFGVYEMPQAGYELLIQTEMEKTVQPLNCIKLSPALLKEYLENRTKIKEQ